MSNTSLNIENKIFVSIIVPVYNRQKTVARALASIKNQSYDCYEVVIVDDGSTDASAEIIKEFSETDSRFRYIFQENSGKPSIARNNGVKEAKGDWLAFLDSDDEWEVDKLEGQVNTLLSFNNNDDIKLVFTDNKKIIGDHLDYTSFFSHLGIEEELRNSQISVNKYGRLFDRKKFFNQLTACGFLMTQSILVEKNIFVQAGMFDESLVFAEDMDTWLTVTRHCSVAESFAGGFMYYCHNDNITKEKTAAFYQDTIMVLGKHERLLFSDGKPVKALRTRILIYKLEHLAFNLKRGRWPRGIINISSFLPITWNARVVKRILDCFLLMRVYFFNKYLKKATNSN